MTEPLTTDDLERVRDNQRDVCGGCGCVPRLEHDGLMHWHHNPGCAVMARILDDTSGT